MTFPFRRGVILQPAPAHVPNVNARFPLVGQDGTHPDKLEWLTPADVLGDDGQPDALGNDTLGDCFPCAFLRYVQVWDKEEAWKPTRDDAVAVYTRLTGYDGSPATDLGTPTAEAYATIATRGVVVPHRDLPVTPFWASAYREGDALDLDRIRGAIWHFGGLMVGLRLLEGMERVDAWTVDGISGAGSTYVGDHEVFLSGYDKATKTFTGATWGYLVTIEAAVLGATLRAADALLAIDWLDGSTGLAPNGATLAQLDADRAALAA